MKLKKVFAGVVAAALACSTVAVSAFAAGEKSYYDFGGQQVTWGTDADGDENPDTAGVGTDSWIGTLDENGNGTIKVPVTNGDTVEVVCNSWTDFADHVMFTANGEDVTPAQSVTFTITEDITEFAIDIAWGEADGDNCGFNDWCGNLVIVTAGDPVETPETQAPADDDPQVGETEPAPGDCTGDAGGDDNGNTSVDDGGNNNPGTGVAVAVAPAVLAAGALAAAVVIRKRK